MAKIQKRQREYQKISKKEPPPSSIINETDTFKDKPIFEEPLQEKAIEKAWRLTEVKFLINLIFFFYSVSLKHLTYLDVHIIKMHFYNNKKWVETKF